MSLYAFLFFYVHISFVVICSIWDSYFPFILYLYRFLSDKTSNEAKTIPQKDTEFAGLFLLVAKQQAGHEDIANGQGGQDNNNGLGEDNNNGLAQDNNNGDGEEDIDADADGHGENGPNGQDLELDQ
jgi:hypothetical protein